MSDDTQIKTSTVFDTILTEKQLQEISGFSKNFFAKARMNGTGPKFIKAGRHIRYRQSDVEDWLNQRVYTTTEEAARANVA